MLVIQWGFIGGLVYTSIDLLSRFLRKDLNPRVYINSSFRLLLSSVVAIIIYLIYFWSTLQLANNVNVLGTVNDPNLPSLLLLSFLAGVAPISILINFADTYISNVSKGWARRSIIGNKPLTYLEGINSITAERLSEEGLDYIQQMALCKPLEISSRTRFPLSIVENWKDQAVLYLLTEDITFVDNESQNKKSETESLSAILDKKLGIRTMSTLVNIASPLITNPKISEEQESFFNSLGILDDQNGNLVYLSYLFKNILCEGKKMMEMENKNPTRSSITI